MNLQCGKVPVAIPVTVLHKGTERFNVVMQQYPLTYLVSKERMNKYIKLANLKKYDKPVQRTIGSKLEPKSCKAKIADGTYFWKEVLDKEMLFNRVTSKPVIVNRFTDGIREGIYCWLQPKKGSTDMILAHAKDGLLDKSQGADGRVIANPKAAGTPKANRISGQEFYVSGPGTQWNRQKLKDQLSDYFTPRIIQQLPQSIWPPKGMYMQLEYIFFRNLDEATLDKNNVIQDLDNHSYPYMKVFKDTLQQLGVIKGDDPRYIRGGYPHYVHIDNDEDRRLEIKIHFCENEQAIQRPIYEYTDPEVTLTIDPL